MTMYHHGDIPYAVAAENAAAWVRPKYEEQISAGRGMAKQALKDLEANQPEDHFIWHNDIEFFQNGGGDLRLRDKKHEDQQFSLHRNALTQISQADRAGVPIRYIDDMIKSGQTDLAVSNLNRRCKDMEPLKSGRPRRFNARTVRGETRAILTDSYAIWDSSEIVKNFIEKIMSMGAVLVHAHCSDLQFSFSAVIAQIFEPVQNEIMLVGVALKGSDFGNSDNNIASLLDRVWCTNLARGEKILSQIHSRRKYTDAEIYNRKVVDAETKLITEKQTAIVDRYLSPEFVELQLNQVVRAGKEPIDNISDAINGLPNKSRLTEEETEKVKAYYESKDEELLTPGKTKARFAACLGLLAQQSDADRARELETTAGDVFGMKALEQ